MKRLNITLPLLLAILTLSPINALGWNIPGHMLNGAISYQLLYRDSPGTIPKVRAILEKHPWYANLWREGIAKLPDSQRDETLFMLAARWADDIRTRDPSQSHPPWHYVDFPFKPEGESASVQLIEPPDENIITAISKNKRIV